MSRLSGSSLLLAAALCVLPATTLAQTQAPPADTPNARAITTGQQGIQAYEQGKWLKALEHFREAEALYHSPVFALFAARSQRQLGQLLEARATLQRLVGESLATDAPAPWVKAQAEARLELAELAAEVPTVTLAIEEGSATASITLDDQPAEPRRPIELNPGQHRAVITDGARRREITFNVTARTHPTLTLSLARPRARTALAPGRPTPPPSTLAPRARRPYLPGWILTGTGALAIASGGVVGILALKKRSELRDDLPSALLEACRQDRCLESQRSVIDGHFAPARNLALASDILWISGAVLAATGVTLIVVDPRSKSASLNVGGRF
ncbi:MAG TPA: hypothetical protein VJN18_10090 [Polyangiaceae bacterium]|nr:hypothetical protein [Polyangiaceae bacterium]